MKFTISSFCDLIKRYKSQREICMNKIAEIRNQIGISQAQLAVQIGWRQPRIANYETGNRTPSIYVAQKIVEGLNELGANVRIDDVFPVGN